LRPPGLREPIDLATACEVRLAQLVRLAETRAAALREIVEAKAWDAIVEQGRGFLELGRLILEDGKARDMVAAIEAGVYKPITARTSAGNNDPPEVKP